jgi:hypothetical protein
MGRFFEKMAHFIAILESPLGCLKIPHYSLLDTHFLGKTTVPPKIQADTTPHQNTTNISIIPLICECKARTSHIFQRWNVKSSARK